MQFCQQHWDQLRLGLDTHHLTYTLDPAEAMAKMAATEITKDTFDPLVCAHNALFNRVCELITKQYSQSPMMLFVTESPNPPGTCPICVLNWCHLDHVTRCTNESCDYPVTYDWAEELIPSVVHYIVEQAKEFT